MSSEVVKTNEELVELVQQGVDVQDNLKILYEQNKRYIYKIANPFMKYAEADDILQEAYIGFQEAVYDYIPGDAKLTTYAAWKIRKNCIRYLENFSNTKRIPSATYNLLRKYKSFIQEYQNECGTVPDDKVIMRELELTPKTLERIKKAIYEQHCISFSERLSTDEDLTLEDTLADDYDMESDIEDKLFREHQREVLDNAIGRLKENEQHVIRSRYWDEQSQIQLSEEMNISNSRVGQIEKDALRKLRKNDSLQELLDTKYGYGSQNAYHMSTKGCIDRHTSSTEQLALKRLILKEKQLKLEAEVEEMLSEYLGQNLG